MILVKHSIGSIMYLNSSNCLNALILKYPVSVKMLLCNCVSQFKCAPQSSYSIQFFPVFSNALGCPHAPSVAIKDLEFKLNSWKYPNVSQVPLSVKYSQLNKVLKCLKSPEYPHRWFLQSQFLAKLCNKFICLSFSDLRFESSNGR